MTNKLNQIKSGDENEKEQSSKGVLNNLAEAKKAAVAMTLFAGVAATSKQAIADESKLKRSLTKQEINSMCDKNGDGAIKGLKEKNCVGKIEVDQLTEEVDQGRVRLAELTRRDDQLTEEVDQGRVRLAELDESIKGLENDFVAIAGGIRSNMNNN